MTGGVVFDLDETLIDRQASIAAYAHRFWRHFENEIRLPEAAFVERFLTLDDNGYTDRQRFFDEVAVGLTHPGLGRETVSGHFMEHAWSRPTLMQGAVDVCRRLRAAGIPVGVVSNGSSRSQRRKLNAAGLAELVNHVVISEEFGVKKPHPSIFLEVCLRLGIEAQASWFVGDNPELDIIGASGVGFRTLWLRRATPWPEQRPPCHTHAIDSLSEVLEHVLPGVCALACDAPDAGR